MAQPAPSAQNFLMQLLERKDLLAIIIDSLTETISKYTGTPTTAGKPFLVQNTNKANIAVAGLIRFEESDFSIELFLGLSKELFESLYESIFQNRPGDITPENHDLAGEILNVAFGIMDPKLRAQKLKLRSSLPAIYSKEPLQSMLSRIEAQAIGVPFQNGGNTFVIEIYSADGLKEKWRFDP